MFATETSETIKEYKAIKLKALPSLKNCVAVMAKGKTVPVWIILTILLLLVCKRSKLFAMLAELSLMENEVT